MKDSGNEINRAKNPYIQKKKKNKEQEKDEVIMGEEIYKNELNKNYIEEFSKEIKLISNLKNDFYKKLYEKETYCDYREDEKKEWKVVIIKDILDNNKMKIKDLNNDSSEIIEIKETSKIAYFRKFSKISENIIFSVRDSKKILKNKLENIEIFINENNFKNNKRDIYEIYYFIHSKIFLGLDSAMKINSNDSNEGSEESFRIILKILLFISQYYQFLLDNKDDFINYENNKKELNNSELIDLKVVNKKIAFFSFFGESIMLLNKIFANCENYLSWYVTFEKKLQKFVPSVIDEDIKPNPNTEYYPIYEDQINIYQNKNKLLLKKICIECGYNLNVTFSTENTEIKSTFLAYFIDYFYALNGFKYLFQLCICHKPINIKLLLKLLNGLNSAKTMTQTYKNLYLNEKKILLKMIYEFIDQLNEKTIINWEKDDIITLIKKSSNIVAMDKEEESKLNENMYFNYISKNLLLSQKLEQKILSLNILNDILNNIKYNMNHKKYKNSYSDIPIKKMSFQDFCVNCKINAILQILLKEENVHEEIIKRLPEIIFTMYSNNFGYINKSDSQKIKSDKKMIFDTLFNKLTESDQNNEEKTKNINEIIYDFTEILSEEDKFYFYNEIKKYFEKSIEKKGMPIKDQLLFLIEFSIRAISSKNLQKGIKENNKNSNIKNKKAEQRKNEKKNEESEEEDEEEEDDEIIDNEDVSFSKEDDKLFNFKIEDKDYYFLNLLKRYLEEDEYKKYNMTNEQKIELINISSEGIIKIIENSNSKERDLLLKDLFFKTTGALEKSVGVVQLLNLIDKIRKNNKINTKFNLILENYGKDYDFLSSLMNDMTRYLSLINSSNNDKNKLNDKNGNEEVEEKKIYEGLFENKINIELRLKLILFLLESIDDESDLINFKKLVLVCQTNTFTYNCLNKLLFLNIKRLDSIFIVFFFKNFLEGTKLYNVNDCQYYKLCKEIIKEINVINNIFYYMNNKDLLILNSETESKINGIDILWQFLVETRNDRIRNDITDFLAEIFFGIRKNYEKFWNNFIKTIYSKLDEIIKFKNKNEQAIRGIISLIKKIEKKANYKGEIIYDISQILNEIKINKYNMKKKNKKEKKNKKIVKEFTFIKSSEINSNNKLNYDIKIDSTEYFYMLRYKLSNFFKIPVNTVKVYIEEEKYDKKINEELKGFELDLFNDYDNTYSIFENLEKIISNKNKEEKQNGENKKKENNIALIFKVKSLENEKLKNIKTLFKDVSKLTELLKCKNAEYILDVWSLIKDEDKSNININIIQNIKDILLKGDSNKYNSIFDFENTNIYYTSYILSNLIHVMNELNDKDKTFINKIFLKSWIWNEKIKNIKIEKNEKIILEEIYEKNNTIKHLLNIYKIISENANEENIFILNKNIEYYYLMIKESIDFKELSSLEELKVRSINDLYIQNSILIRRIIFENKNMYEYLINELSSSENKRIRNQFEFLFFEGIIKNKNILLNYKLQEFFINLIIDNKNLKIINDNTLNETYLYLLNYFLSEKAFENLINYIKEILQINQLDASSEMETYENNIIIFFDIINKLIEKIFPIINNKFNFKYISKIILQKINNPIIEDILLDLSYHEIILGGFCKILLSIFSSTTNYKEILNFEKNKEKLLKDYIFEEIIMNKCHKNIYNEKNLDNYKSISITKSYSFKQAVNLFIFLLVQNMNNCDKNEEIKYYLDKLTDLHNQSFWKKDNSSDWKLSFNDNKNTSPFVGLKNLGCTCYMNSLLQIFFHFVPFRESLLQCESKEEMKNSLYQIKKLFYSLKYLKINYYNPEEFIQNYDNEILNVHQQMDVDEFYSNIVEKIENRLKGTKDENLVKYFFQGKQNDVLTFQNGCTHHRINTNNFYSIQLQVKNKKNIYESLDSLTEGELMNGDNCIFCPHCNKKLPVIKSQNFKSLPRILLLVLKRFEFNYDTMIKEKIDDFYEFPFELDMTKYIAESNKKKNNINNIYTLKSVVIHMGNCENGHYYSFIKIKNGKWYEFNDTHVKQFDINLLNEEAFGGEEVLYFNGKQNVQKKNRSAYLLFYEKKNQSDCEQFDHIDAITSFLKKENNNFMNKKNTIKEEINILIDDGNSNLNNINKNTNNNNVEENKRNIDEINKNNNNIGINGSGKNDIIGNINLEMFKYFLCRKLFSNEYQYFILELYLNILNYYYNYDLSIFLMHLCRNLNNRTTEILREIQASGSNLNLYLDTKKLILFKTNNEKITSKANYSEQILYLFKAFIIYFYNIFLRTKEKEYLGGMVDLIKFLINDQSNCANYLIEEFCNEKTIIEYLINCTSYEIKKLIVGILYCAMTKSLKDNELLILKGIKEKEKKKIVKEKEQIKHQISKEDEELARQLQNEDGNDYIYNYEDNNPLEYKNIPKNMLKMIYNILSIIKMTKFNKMNEHRFLYFTIYRFSLISQNTREFLIYKCRLLEFLCLFLHNDHQENEYSLSDITLSIFIGPYTVNHSILCPREKDGLKIFSDKGGVYKNENYLYMLYFYLLSYTPPKDGQKRNNIYDSGYSLENKDFISVLLNNIRTKQDAFCFSNYIIEKSKDSKSKAKNVYEALKECFIKIDNNDKINYEYNNYKNYVKHNMNENPDKNDPGINPKYLIIIFKKFILSHSNKEDLVKRGIKILFELFSKNQEYYSYSIMIIDLILELFSKDFQKYPIYFEDELEKIKAWLEKWSIPPLKYHIEGISMYKYMKINYDNNLSEEKKNEFNDIELINTQKKIDKIYDLLSGDIKEKNESKFDKDLDLSDFKFIIGDTILYQNNERVIEEALDELLKISVEVNIKANNKNGVNDRRDIWIEIDNPTIEIKELKGK